MGLRSCFRNTSATQTHPEIQIPHPIFSIHEIIQKILLEVPAIDLLTNCRGVCRTWKVLIEVSSPDLKYYSLSGLRRSRPGADTASDGQILSPLAVEVLTRFWKRLAAQTVGGIRDSENHPIVKKEQQSRRSRHPRSPDRSRKTGVRLWSASTILTLCLWPVAAVAYHFYDKILRPFGPTSRKYRAIRKIGIQLIKEFQPIWQKIHIFNPDPPEGAAVLVRTATDWRSCRGQSLWRYQFYMDESFESLPHAALILMRPLVKAVYSRHPGPMPDAAEYGDTGSSVIIDLKHISPTSDEDYAQRYTGYTTREVITLNGHQPFNVYREHKRPPDSNFALLDNQIVRL